MSEVEGNHLLSSHSYGGYDDPQCSSETDQACSCPELPFHSSQDLYLIDFPDPESFPIESAVPLPSDQPEPLYPHGPIFIDDKELDNVLPAGWNGGKFGRDSAAVYVPGYAQFSSHGTPQSSGPPAAYIVSSGASHPNKSLATPDLTPTGSAGAPEPTTPAHHLFANVTRNIPFGLIPTQSKTFDFIPYVTKDSSEASRHNTSATGYAQDQLAGEQPYQHHRLQPPYLTGSSKGTPSIYSEDRVSSLSSGKKEKKRIKCPEPECGKWLADRDTLYRHGRTHDEHKKAYYREHCMTCSAVFKNPKDLKRHYTSHSDAQPMQCKHPGCEQRFKRFDNAKRHVIAKHKVPPHTAHLRISTPSTRTGTGIVATDI